jgi:hypothetical protein
MEDLRRWLELTLQNLSAKSDMAGAIRYALTRWTALTRYLDDRTIEIDAQRRRTGVARHRARKEELSVRRF